MIEEDKILEILAKNLSLQEIGELIYQNQKDYYQEKPVFIDQFIDDPNYLGKLKIDVYPIWRKKLRKIHPSPFINTVNEVIVQGGQGIGKTFGLANISLAYELHKLISLIDPSDYFSYAGISSGTPIVFKLFSSDLALAQSVNWEDLLNVLERSPWFQKWFTVKRTKTIGDTKGIDLCKNIRLEIGSRVSHATGRNTIGGVMDEANNPRAIESQMQENYIALTNRRKNRFAGVGGLLPGIFFLLGEAEDENSFIEQRIKNLEGNPDNKTTMIIKDVSIWTAKKHLGVYSTQGVKGQIDKTFPVFLGNETKDPFIVEDPKLLSSIEPKRVLNVPDVKILRDSFKEDLLTAIKKLGGISSSQLTNLFRSKESVLNIMSKRSTGFTQEIIQLDFKDEKETLMHYIDTEYFKGIFNKFKNRSQPKRCIHLDMAKTRDRLGMACVYSENIHKEIYADHSEISKIVDKTFTVEWLIAIEAKPGSQIPFYKVRNFLYYLKKNNYRIDLVTTDKGVGGDDMRQELERRSFKVDYLSVDTSREPYFKLRDIVLSELIDIAYHYLLFLELTHLRDDGKKIDHPNKFSVNNQRGSKDLSDAVAGALWSCLNLKEHNVINNEIMNEFSQGLSYGDKLEKLYNDNEFNNFLDNFEKTFGW